MSWTNRRHHVEALENNTVGFIRLKPEPSEYKSADGRVSAEKRFRLIEDFISTLHVISSIEPSRITISYPGDVEFFVTFRTAVEGTEIIGILDRLAQEARRTHLQPGAMVGVPFDFQLVLWSQRDPDAVSLGRLVDEGGV